MPYDSFKHHRRSVRLQTHNYARGTYFVTLCTYARLRLFDDPLVNHIATQQWERLPTFFDGVTLDEWIIMPDHLHGILHIDIPFQPESKNDHRIQSQDESHKARTYSGTLGAIMRTYKSRVTSSVHKQTRIDVPTFWQRGYWERIVRDDAELDAVRKYIIDNPVRWAENRDNLDELHRRMTDM